MKNILLFKRNSRLCCILILQLLCLPAFAFQQQQPVTGVVSDVQGTLPGVNITIKGTTNGTFSDQNGYYSVKANQNDVLVFSFIGYKTYEVTITDSTVIDVIMTEDATEIEGVVINAGYYSVKDRERTGSISRVTAKDIEKQPVSNPLAAMQGRMAGVHITQTTGVPGGGFDVQIRGKNSLRADGNTPLYIVDGIPFGSDNLGDSSISVGILRSGLSPLNILNPNDIESVEILKDADATAIYGSRGANGVVLITTKKGKQGKTQFKVNSYTGLGQVTRKLDLMNTEQYLKMREQAFANDGLTELPTYAYDVNGTWDRDRYTDWQDELIGGTAYTNSVQATVSGGSESTRFLIGGTHYKETTVFPGDFAYKKAALNFNINHQSNDKKFEVSLSGNYMSDQNNLMGTDLTYQAYTLAPNAPKLYTEDNKLNWENSTWVNPIAQLEEKYLAKNNTIISNGLLLFRPTDDWEFKTAMGFTDSFLDESKASPHTMFNPAYGLGSEVSTLYLNTARMQSWNFEPQISYRKELFGGILNALVGATFQSRSRKQSGFMAWGYSSNNLINNMAAASNIITTGANNSEYRYNALFSRVNYSYKDKYYLNLTGRRDGSSRFGPGKRFANFGAVGAAWLFSRETIFDENLSWLSFGKLRGSYGTTGSDLIGDYQYMNTYGLTGIGYSGIIGLEPMQLFNPNFSWETNKKVEGAIELGFLKDKLLLNIAHFRSRSSNQLVGIPLPGITGFSMVRANLNATVENTGWEFELNSQIVENKNVSWNSSLNLTVPNNKLIAFPDLEGSTYANQYIIGQALDIKRVYHFTGINPETGVYEFEDYDADGMITAENDREKIINTSPVFYGGWQNNFTYKNWGFDFLFQFVKKLGSNYNSIGVLPGVANNLPVDLLDTWQAPGDTSNVQPFTTGLNPELTNAFYKYLSSDAAYSDASFIRLKNVSLTYTLPQLFESVECKLYMQGQNIFTLTKFKGADPENNSFSSLPPLRVISMGLHLNF